MALPIECTNKNNIVCVPKQTGTYTATCVVTDSKNNKVTTTGTLTVQ